MLLRHATPRRNLTSIKRTGLLTAKSQGRMPAVWLHSPARSAWATLHVVKRHGGRVENTVTFEVDVPRSWLRRSRKGIWYTKRDVPPERFRRVIDFIEVAGQSPAA
jgi:RNA:NAD 2'-phosphotransferase (TPT1/KptA family)